MSSILLVIMYYKIQDNSMNTNILNVHCHTKQQNYHCNKLNNDLHTKQSIIVFFFLSIFSYVLLVFKASEHPMDYILLNRALHIVCEYVDDTMPYSFVSSFDERIRPKSVQLPLRETKGVHHRALSHEPPFVRWRRSSTNITHDRETLIKIFSKKTRKIIEWNRIRHAPKRIDCWNPTYRRPKLKRKVWKPPTIFYEPKPRDTWHEESVHMSMKRHIHEHVQRVVAKPRIDTWLRKSYVPMGVKRKIFNKPIQIQGKSRVDTWMRENYRGRSTSARVRYHRVRQETKATILTYSCSIDYQSTDTNRRQK
jgi:hypothetical protein